MQYPHCPQIRDVICIAVVLHAHVKRSAEVVHDFPRCAANFCHPRSCWYEFDGIKAAYAKLIGYASRATYGVKDDRIYMTVVAPEVDD